MRARLLRLDLTEARDLHTFAFPTDAWPGDDHAYWRAMVDGELAGFCSAVLRPEGYRRMRVPTVFLSRAAVTARYQGLGIQRHMIHARVRWARAQGAAMVVTYATHDNYPSIANLLRCRFRLATPPRGSGFEGGRYFFFHRPIASPGTTRV